jgi:hypothetical protein
LTENVFVTTPSRLTRLTVSHRAVSRPKKVLRQMEAAFACIDGGLTAGGSAATGTFALQMLKAIPLLNWILPLVTG